MPSECDAGEITGQKMAARGRGVVAIGAASCLPRAHNIHRVCALRLKSKLFMLRCVVCFDLELVGAKWMDDAT